MSNIEYIRDFLITCPFIKVSPLDLHINFIGENPMQYSIDQEPTQPVIKKYLNGDTIRRFSFALTSRSDTISDDDRTENNKNYERLSIWLEEQSRLRKLPAMADDKRPLSIQATGGAYLMDRAEDDDSAIYLMQIEFQYFEKARM